MIQLISFYSKADIMYVDIIYVVLFIVVLFILKNTCIYVKYGMKFWI